MDGSKVISGPADIYASSTLLGHTKAGAEITVLQASTRVTSHESGDAPIDIHPRGAPNILMTVDLMEITAANLALISNCATITTASVVGIQGGDLCNTNLPTFDSVKIIQQTNAGTTVTAALQNVTVVPDEMMFMGRNEDDTAWYIRGAFAAKFVDSGTMLELTGVS